ncbi:MAG TPA: hypothetical protein VN764_06135 [Polyangiaceae bacterium]|nr:hypothetical protein [Polyangiaceae bacterium]
MSERPIDLIQYRLRKAREARDKFNAEFARTQYFDHKRHDAIMRELREAERAAHRPFRGTPC